MGDRSGMYWDWRLTSGIVEALWVTRKRRADQLTATKILLPLPLNPTPSSFDGTPSSSNNRALSRHTLGALLRRRRGIHSLEVVAPPTLSTSLVRARPAVPACRTFSPSCVVVYITRSTVCLDLLWTPSFAPLLAYDPALPPYPLAHPARPCGVDTHPNSAFSFNQPMSLETEPVHHDHNTSKGVGVWTWGASPPAREHDASRPLSAFRGNTCQTSPSIKP